MVKQKNQKKSDAEKNATTVNTSTTLTNTAPMTTTVNASANNTGGVSQTTTSGSSSSANRNNTTTVNTNNKTPYQQNQQKRDREKSTSSNQGNNSYRKTNNSTESRGSRDYNKDRNNSHYLSTNGSYSKNKNRDNSSHSRKGGNSNHYSSSTSLANSTTNGIANQSQNVEAKKTDLRKLPSGEENKKSVWSANTTITQEQGTDEERLENKSEVPPIQQSFFAPTKKFKDTVLSYIECGEWDRVELICELVSLLDAFDLRLVYNCIEANQRTYTSQLKPMEKRANSLNPLYLFPAPDENFHQYFGDGRLVIETPSSSSSTSDVCANPAPSIASNLSNPNDAKSSTCDVTSEVEKTAEKKKPSEERMGQVIFEKPSDLPDALYVLVALCESTNRKSAHLISLYVEAYCMSSREYHLSKISDINDRIKVLETMGKVVSACLHHPAFSVSDKMKYAHARDQIRNEYDQMVIHAELTSKCPGTVGGCKYVSNRGVGDIDADDEKSQTDNYHIHHLNSASSTSPVQMASPVNFVYIQRFIGRYLEADDKFQIEIHWSDRDQTFTSRSREQLKVLQHRLLDEFGQQQRQEQSMTMSNNLDDENQLSTSTSSDAHSSSGRRILPRLNHDASPSEIVQYINELSDMPARMMLSKAICEEFNATRNKTSEDDSHLDGVSLSRWRPPPSVPSFPRLTTPVSTTSNYAVSFVPMIYGSVPQNQLQVFQTTCSTCGGGHSYLFCPEMPILDRKKYLDEKGTQTKQTASSAPPQQPQYAYTGPDGTHFSHHQNLFMQHQTRYIPQVIHMYDPNASGAYFSHPQPNLSYTNGNYN